MEAERARGLDKLKDVFGDRLMQHPGQGNVQDDVIASVRPVNGDEVRQLARTAREHAMTLTAVGGGTAPGANEAVPEGAVLVRFDLMRGVRLPDTPADAWVETEPGTLWLQMDNELRLRGMGLTVYPTSAPRATVGGWLATDGLGVGSFRYGRLRENVLRARVVLPDGELREVAGWEVGDYVGPHAGAGIVVGARLRTRRADRDVPFAAAFADLEGLLGAAEALIEASAPLWHLAFLNPPMAMVRGLGTDPLLFGAYPLVGSEEADRDLRTAVRWHGGRLLEAAEAYRVWGERFYPVAPSRPTAEVVREFVPLDGLRPALDARTAAGVQGTVSRSGETLLLALDPANVAGLTT